MGKIKKFINGTYVGELEGFEANSIDDIIGKPYLCVFGAVEPRHARGSKIATWDLVGDLKAYIRFTTSEKVTETLNRDKAGTGTIVCTEEMIEHFGLDRKKLLDEAMQNMDADGFEVISMFQFIADAIGDDRFIENVPADGPMIVRSKTFEQWGASIIANHKALEDIRAEHGDFSIIPCSLGELIIVPESRDIDPDYMKMMVKEVNGSVVQADEVLSDNIFRFDSLGLNLA